MQPDDARPPAGGSGRAAKPVEQTTSSIEPAPWFAENLHWSDVVEWWTSPALAYLAGLQHGVRMERERQAADDDAAHRDAVRKALRVLEVGDARTRAAARWSA